MVLQRLWPTGFLPPPISESPTPVPRSGCCTGLWRKLKEPLGFFLSVILQKLLPSPLGADTYAALSPSAGTRMLGSAPPPANISGALKVAPDVPADAGRERAAPDATRSPAASRPRRVER